MYVYMYTYIQRFILSNWLTEAGKSRIYRVGWQPGDPRRADVTVQIQSPSTAVPPA